MSDDHPRLADPAFRRLLARRSRWRWSLSGLLIGAYLLYALGGVYFADAYAKPLPNSAIPQGIAAGFLIIALSILLSVWYVRIINRIEAAAARDKGGRR